MQFLNDALFCLLAIPFSYRSNISEKENRYILYKQIYMINVYNTYVMLGIPSVVDVYVRHINVIFLNAFSSLLF